MQSFAHLAISSCCSCTSLDASLSQGQRVPSTPLDHLYDAHHSSPSFFHWSKLRYGHGAIDGLGCLRSAVEPVVVCKMMVVVHHENERGVGGALPEALGHRFQVSMAERREGGQPDGYMDTGSGRKAHRDADGAPIIF